MGDNVTGKDKNTKKESSRLDLSHTEVHTGRGPDGRPMIFFRGVGHPLNDTTSWLDSILGKKVLTPDQSFYSHKKAFASRGSALSHPDGSVELSGTRLTGTLKNGDKVYTGRAWGDMDEILPALESQRLIRLRGEQALQKKRDDRLQKDLAILSGKPAVTEDDAKTRYSEAEKKYKKSMSEAFGEGSDGSVKDMSLIGQLNRAMQDRRKNLANSGVAPGLKNIWLNGDPNSGVGITFAADGMPFLVSPKSYSGMLVKDAANLRLGVAQMAATARTLRSVYNHNKELETRERRDWLLSAEGQDAYENAALARLFKDRMLKEKRAVRAEIGASQRLQDAGYTFADGKWTAPGGDQPAPEPPPTEPPRASSAGA